jgi:hypothetical protein
MEKNALSYHRILCECKAWKGPGHLKMYPTWGRSQRDELKRIGAKYGKCRRKMSIGEKLSAKEQIIRPASIEGERVMDKERDVKRQTKDIVEVDRVILHSSLHIKKINLDGHIEPEPTSSAIKNFDDQTLVKLTRKDVEEQAKMVANELTNSSDFNLGPPPEEVYVHGLYIIITKIEDEWMHRSLLDQPEQCVNFFKLSRKTECSLKQYLLLLDRGMSSG